MRWTSLGDDEDTRFRQLAGEVAIRALLDVRLLQRRGIMEGVRHPKNKEVAYESRINYPDKRSVSKLIKDIKDGTLLFWFRAGGANIDQNTLVRLLKDKNARIYGVCS